MALNQIQEEIKKALVALGERSRFSEAILAKKIRENTRFDGKKKAGLSLLDIEKASDELFETDGVNYSFMMNSANDLLIERTLDSRRLEGEVRQRRLKSEKSMTLFTNGDFTGAKGEKGGKAKKNGKRADRRKMNVNGDFELD